MGNYKINIFPDNLWYDTSVHSLTMLAVVVIVSSSLNNSVSQKKKKKKKKKEALNSYTKNLYKQSYIWQTYTILSSNYCITILISVLDKNFFSCWYFLKLCGVFRYWHQNFHLHIPDYCAQTVYVYTIKASFKRMS